MSEIRIKICGLKDPETLNAAIDAGAAYIGFNFFQKSPRSVTLEEASALAAEIPEGIAKVALVVDPSDQFLDDLTGTVPIDMIQLHGTEEPYRVAEIKQRYGLPVMKAIGIRTADDVAKIDIYSHVADQLLIDAKAPEQADLPGGNGVVFDWSLLSGRKYWTRPWLLAGGLTPENVGAAIKATGARQIDVASGVESAPGVKSADRIRAFCAAARG